MTTIVATRTHVWADSQCTSADPFKTSKIRTLEYKGNVETGEEGEEYLAGGCGFLTEIHYMMELIQHYGLKNLWSLHEDQHWPPRILKNADSDVLVVTRSKEIWMVTDQMMPFQLDQDWYATGSGGNYATAWMDAGKTPHEAIEYAATRDPYTKGPVREIHFSRKRK